MQSALYCFKNEEKEKKRKTQMVSQLWNCFVALVLFCLPSRPREENGLPSLQPSGIGALGPQGSGPGTFWHPPATLRSGFRLLFQLFHGGHCHLPCLRVRTGRRPLGTASNCCTEWLRRTRAGAPGPIPWMVQGCLGVVSPRIRKCLPGFSVSDTLNLPWGRVAAGRPKWLWQ